MGYFQIGTSYLYKCLKKNFQHPSTALGQPNKIVAFL